MTLSISGLRPGSLTSGIEPFRQRQREASSTVDADTVTTNSRTPLTDTDASALINGVQGTLSTQRVDALSAHSGLDYTRAMKLLEGLE